MTYNFRDEPAPSMSAEIDPAGGVFLQDGSPQGNIITDAFSGSSVSVSIIPPQGWSLDSVSWSNGGNGTLSVPAPGVEEVHPFSYTVSQNGTRLSSNGHFKIKKQSDGSG